MDQWVRVDEVSTSRSKGAGTAARVERSGEGRNAAARVHAVAGADVLPEAVANEIRGAAATATPRQREALVERMQRMLGAFSYGRYEEVARLGRGLANAAPEVLAVRQLLGLASYQLGRWREAVRQLEAYREMSGESDAVPPLMDAYRALGRRRKVSELWTQLRHGVADADVLAEARIVAAGTLADSGDLQGAISLLVSSGAAKALRNPADRHLRQWYALGDLYERAGDLPSARELFTRVQRVDPEAYDVTDRVAGLGRSSRQPRRRRAESRRTNSS